MRDAGFGQICRHWGYDLSLPDEPAKAFARGQGEPATNLRVVLLGALFLSTAFTTRNLSRW